MHPSPLRRVLCGAALTLIAATCRSERERGLPRTRATFEGRRTLWANDLPVPAQRLPDPAVLPHSFGTLVTGPGQASRQRENVRLGIPRERAARFARRLREPCGDGVCRGRFGHIGDHAPIERLGQRLGQPRRKRTAPGATDARRARGAVS